MSRLTASQEVINSPQYAALSAYLADPERELRSALDAFAQPLESKHTSGSNTSDVEGSLWIAWQGVVAIGASTPHSDPKREKLANLLVRLLYRPNLVVDGQTCEVDSMAVWRDLPVLGWELREAWNSVPSDKSTQDEKDQWISLNAFTATSVASLHSSAVDRPDYSLFCIWTLRTALEDSNEPSAVAVAVAVAAAAVWLIYASPAIWDFSQLSRTFDGKLAAPGPLFQSDGWRGFSKARWEAWAQRLRDLKDTMSTDDGTALVEQALQAMASASGS